MAVELKTKVVRGFAWNVAEKVASALFQAWVVVNVLNRLVPDETAPVAILAAFVVVFNVFVDSGFSSALIRKKDPSPADFSSAFWFNAAMSLVVYGVLAGLSYPTARLLQMADLPRLAPVFFLIIPFGALGLIRQTRLTREFDFRRLSTIFFASNVVSGLVAVCLAFAGAGVWSLVVQRVTQTLTRTLLLWIPAGRHSETRDTAFAAVSLKKISFTSIREMFGYSSRLLATDLINNLFTSIPNFVIGRIHGATLGIYDTARKVRDLPVNSTMIAMQSVTFPALSRIRDNDDKFSRAAGRVVGSIVFLMFPMMAGLIAVSGELFGLFLAPQWQPSMLFFRILCLAGFATPLAIISSNILRSRSDGRAVLRAEIAKKLIAALILATTIPLGIIAIAWGVVAIAFTDAAVSFTVARRESSYGFRALARDVLPTLALTVAMAAAVYLVSRLAAPIIASKIVAAATGIAAVATPAALSKTILAALLAIKIATGVAVYFAGAALLRIEAFREFTGMIKNFITKSADRPADR